MQLLQAQLVLARLWYFCSEYYSQKKESTQKFSEPDLILTPSLLKKKVLIGSLMISPNEINFKKEINLFLILQYKHMQTRIQYM